MTMVMTARRNAGATAALAATIAYSCSSTASAEPVRAPLWNGVGDLPRELAYARASSGISGRALVPGTRPFSSSL